MLGILIVLLSVFAIVATLTLICLLEINRPRSAKNVRGSCRGAGRD